LEGSGGPGSVDVGGIPSSGADAVRAIPTSTARARLDPRAGKMPPPFTAVATDATDSPFLAVGPIEGAWPQGGVTGRPPPQGVDRNG
jgi:hypothetical protein